MVEINKEVFLKKEDLDLLYEVSTSIYSIHDLDEMRFPDSCGIAGWALREKKGRSLLPLTGISDRTSANERAQRRYSTFNNAFF